jgi:pyocin large subunit-like protein
MKFAWFAGAAALAVVSLAGCGKPSAVATAPQSAAGGSGQVAGAPTYGARTPDPRDAPVPKVEGKPMWAANRKHTAEENAQYQFAKNGGDFSAKSESEYVLDVHHFVDHPPRSTETVDRPNGDKLMYDPKANVFAVVARNGAPRTMFKPRDGASYWSQQKDREARRAKGGSDSGGGGTQES